MALSPDEARLAVVHIQGYEYAWYATLWVAPHRQVTRTFKSPWSSQTRTIDRRVGSAKTPKGVVQAYARDPVNSVRIGIASPQVGIAHARGPLSEASLEQAHADLIRAFAGERWNAHPHLEAWDRLFVEMARHHRELLFALLEDYAQRQERQPDHDPLASQYGEEED